jgi:hypothetical protein
MYLYVSAFKKEPKRKKVRNKYTIFYAASQLKIILLKGQCQEIFGAQIEV